jgi:hypothetical protein
MILAQPPHSHPTLPPLDIPLDTSTAIKRLGISPVIQRYICCPTCFARHDIYPLPRICGEPLPSNPTKFCDARLWTHRSTRASNGQKISVPKRMYCTQSFKAWLDVFLSRPGIEDLLQQSYAHRPSAPGEPMHSLWDSPAWREFNDGWCLKKGNLTFSYFIDWFNPFSNKIAGKAVSCGAIMMFCLNLPRDQQHLVENMFLAGITLPPKEPTFETITALQDPIIDGILELWSNESTSALEGPDVQVAVMPVIADLLVIKKACGHAATGHKVHFCHFCKLKRTEIDRVDYKNWEKRLGSEVAEISEQWRDAHTKKEQEAIFAEFGHRWSSLNRLHYRDPIMYLVLGILHNWFEGNLQVQTRVMWGIGASKKGVKEPDDGADDDTVPIEAKQSGDILMDASLAELDEVMMDVDEEAKLFRGGAAQLKRAHTESSIMALSMDSISSDSTVIRNDNMETDNAEAVNVSDKEDEDEDEFAPAAANIPLDTVFTITPEQLAHIHRGLRLIVIPSDIERPPPNLGSKSHGKLKADHWLMLFLVFFPLILPEIWQDPDHLELLQNFYHLVACTHIISSYSVSDRDADQYMEHYIAYRKSTKILFPTVKTRPNHHYAMHNGDLLKFWGPLVHLAEWGYESHNGMLQRIKTNGHLCE